MFIVPFAFVVYEVYSIQYKYEIALSLCVPTTTVQYEFL